MPCLGRRPDVGRGSEVKDYRDCGATQRCRQHGLADCMHTAERLVRTKSRRRSRGALQLIQISPTSHGSSRPHLTDGFLNGKSGLPFPDVIDLGGFQTTLCVRRQCRANLVQLQASLVRTGFLLALTRTGPDCQLCFRERIHRTESVKNNSGAFVGCGSHPHSWARRELVDAIVTRRRPDE